MSEVVSQLTGTIVIAGGSGFLGTALASHFRSAGADVVVLTRSAPRTDGDGCRFVRWNGRQSGDWCAELSGARAVINLTGKNINCRPTRGNLAEIRRSRVDSVEVLGQAVRQAVAPPEVFVQASAVGYYGNRGDACNESDPPGVGALPETCILWERAFDGLDLGTTRKVVLRIGVVLGAGGGALPVLARLTRAFLGGAAGSGHQWVSWIALCDFCRIVHEVVSNRACAGVYNATAPRPVSNAELMRELRRNFHRPWSPPVPGIAIRAGARMMGTNPDLVLTGQRAGPARLLDQEFKFQYPELAGALDA